MRSNAPLPPKPLDVREISEYLDYALEGLLSRRAELLAALGMTAAEHERIDTDDVLAEVAENVRMAQACIRAAEDRRKEHKEPFLVGGKAVDGWFKRFSEPLIAGLEPIQQAMNDYGRRKEWAERAKREAEARAREVEARVAAEQAAEAMRMSSHQADAELERAAETAAIAEQARAAASVRAADLTRTTGIFGAVASVRTTWRGEVEDFDKVPRAFLCIDPVKVTAASRQRGDNGEPLPVPGIRWVAEKKMAVR